MRRINNFITLGTASAAMFFWLLGVLLPAFGFYPIMMNTDLLLPAAIGFTFVACVGWVMIWLEATGRVDMTRCRKCNHILRGLTEPRCPECGEAI